MSIKYNILHVPSGFYYYVEPLQGFLHRDSAEAFIHELDFIVLSPVQRTFFICSKHDFMFHKDISPNIYLKVIEEEFEIIKVYY